MPYALITGASDGIGKELAKCAARDGYDLILTALSELHLKEVAVDLEAEFAIKVHIITADFSDPDHASALWSKARKGRDIEVLVNNAGLGVCGPFAETDWQREQDLINVNILSLTALMKRAVQDMSAQGHGKILNVTSVAGFIPGPHLAVYHASKAYILSLSEAVASELSGSRVRICALCPGPTDTSFFEAADMGSTRVVRLAKLAAPQDVAAAGWRAMKAGKLIEVPGRTNRIITLLPRLLPRWLVTLMAKQLYTQKH